VAQERAVARERVPGARRNGLEARNALELE
jgi:hypothetical protein